jgi:hypothetical protein
MAKKNRCENIGGVAWRICYLQQPAFKSGMDEAKHKQLKERKSVGES